jgi:hypothetical protein
MNKGKGIDIPNLPLQGQYPEHADDEVFDRHTFPYGELYGAKWDADFKPLYRNIWTGDTHMKGHHAASGGPRQRAHYTLSSGRCEHAFCLVWRTMTHTDGTEYRRRCGESMTIDSAQCSQKGHSSKEQKDGPNGIFQKLLRGESVSWKVLKDPEVKEAEVVKDAKQLAQEAAEAAEAALQKEFDEFGVIDTNAMAEMNAQRKKDAKIRAKTEKQARTMARQGKGGKTMKATIPEEKEPEDSVARKRAALDAKAKNGGKRTKRPGA